MKISELPKEVKEKALEYQRNDTDCYYSKSADSLAYAFCWAMTKEGGAYWFDWDMKNVTGIGKPSQYNIGIDTFERMEANCNTEEILAFCNGNIDKYNWRKKGSDLEDFKKIIDYASFAIKQLNGKTVTTTKNKQNN